MRMITGAILIVAAATLLAQMARFEASEVLIGMDSSATGGWILPIFAAIIALFGMYNLFMGSIKKKENTRWYQYSMKALLLIMLLSALFFSGRALGIKEMEAWKSETNGQSGVGMF